MSKLTLPPPLRKNRLREGGESSLLPNDKWGEAPRSRPPRLELDWEHPLPMTGCEIDFCSPITPLKEEA